MNKTYYELYMGGKIKYTVSIHDGIQTHKDGSPFFGINTFKNQVKKNAFVKDLVKQGYVNKYCC